MNRTTRLLLPLVFGLTIAAGPSFPADDGAWIQHLPPGIPSRQEQQGGVWDPVRARMIFYNGEDPATGSAAGCAASWMVEHGVAAPDEQVLIVQGVEMKRPSHLFVRAGKEDNRVVNVRVGGNAVEAMRGEFFL